MRMLGMLPVESVRPNKWNVNAISDEEYAKLKEAIRASGPENMEPIIVRTAEDGVWEIVNGEQRWKIAKELGWKTIPAAEVKIDRKEAKYLCLSYNALRGKVNFVKLSELLLDDPEMIEAATRVFGKAKVEELLESAKSLTDEAKEILSQGVKEGVLITPGKIKAVAEVPQNLQYIAAGAAKSKTLDERFVRSVVVPYIHPKKEEGEEGEGEEEDAKEEKKRVEKPKEYVVGGRAYEVGSYVEIDGRTFLIYFDPERKAVGIAEHKLDYDAYENQFTAPKYYMFEFKCRKCGTTYVEKFDASTGEYEVREKTE